MKNRRIPILTAVITASFAGCIDWDNAQRSWCNDARLEERHAVCGFADTTIAGAAPAVVAAHRFGGAGEEEVAAVATTPNGVWMGGSFSAPVTLGTALTARGGTDAYLARVGAEGQLDSAISFGGSGDDRIVDLEPGPSDSLYIGATFAGSAQLPGGGTVTTQGASDGVLIRLNAALQPTAVFALGASSDARVELHDVDHAPGYVAVAGRVFGSMTLNGVTFGGVGAGAAAFVAVFDEALRPLWHASTNACADAVGDSVAVGPSGEVYFAFASFAGEDEATCDFLGQGLVGEWRDVLVRVDPQEVQPVARWMQVAPDSVRSPFLQPGNPPVLRDGYEAFNSVVISGGDLAYLRHRPDFTPLRKPFTEISFLNPNDAIPTRGGYEFGRATTQQGQGQNMRAKLFVDATDRLWVYGEFIDGEMLLGSGMQNGPFVRARSGFVRVWNHADPALDWARVFVGHTTSEGNAVSGLHVDPAGRTWVLGTFKGNVVATDTWLDAEGTDGYLYVLGDTPQ